MDIKKIAVILFYIMFIYSGFNKIGNFSKKVAGLQQKTGLPPIINVLGMIGVIILELLGSVIMIAHYCKKDIVPLPIVKFTKILYLLFLVVVTFLYHPPTNKIIPFLSNLTTFAGLLYMSADL